MTQLRVALVALVLGLVALSHPPVEAARHPFSLEISPMVALGPADIRIRVRVEPDDANRALSIQLENDRFYRSSYLQLDGKDAPKYHEVTFRRVPGSSEATSISVHLIGASGKVRFYVSKEVQLLDHRDLPLPPGERILVRGSDPRLHGQPVRGALRALAGRCAGCPLRAGLLPDGPGRQHRGLADPGDRPGQAGSDGRQRGRAATLEAGPVGSLRGEGSSRGRNAGADLGLE